MNVMRSLEAFTLNTSLNSFWEDETIFSLAVFVTGNPADVYLKTD